MEIKKTHPTFEQLADFVDGRLSPADISLVERHLTGECGVCRQTAAWIRETTDPKFIQWAEPSPAIRANVDRAFRHYLPAGGEQNKAQKSKHILPQVHHLFGLRMRLVTAVVAVVFLFLVTGSFYRTWAGGVVLYEAAIIEVAGTAEVQFVGSDSWIPLEAETKIGAGDIIRTSADGMVGLQFFDNNAAYLKPNSEMKIVAFSNRRDGEERVISLDMVKGELTSNGWPPGTRLTRLSIRTPKAVVAVQALGYDVYVNTGKGTEISVINGCAEIVSYDAAAHTSYREQSGGACQKAPLPESEPVSPVLEI